MFDRINKTGKKDVKLEDIEKKVVKIEKTP